MQSLTCPSCGAPVPGGAAFCQFCGTSVSPPAGALPSTPAAPGASFVPPPPVAAPPPRRRVSRLVIVILVVVVVLVLVAVVAYAFIAPTSSPPIQVAFIDVWAPDNVCGLNSSPIGYYGYNASTGAAVSLELEVPNVNATACTVQTVVTNTTGFSLSGIQVPLTVPGSGNATMNLTVTSPGSPYSGDLNLVFA